MKIYNPHKICNTGDYRVVCSCCEYSYACLQKQAFSFPSSIAVCQAYFLSEHTLLFCVDTHLHMALYINLPDSDST